ncbi:MAG: rhodanese-like domain-containing protein, partial [Desulfuromonadaceae bacterium]
MKHSYKYLSRRLALLLMALFVCSFTLTGCGSGGGSDDYDEPASTDTAPIDGAETDVLVDSSQLASWIQGGQVTASASSFDRKVVIVDLSTPEDVETYERIKGACLVNLTAELTATRFEGVGDAGRLVATGSQMDAVIQRLGIDENTTIVFPAPGSPYMHTRAYWTFRYWGFDTDQLKLLNGGTPAFAAEYPELMTTTAPTPDPTTFSVRNLNDLNGDLRASVGEMIEIVKDLPGSTENMVFDARGGGSESSYMGTKTTPGLVALDGSTVVFEGHPEGGEFLSWSSLFDEDGKFKSAEEILELFKAKTSFSEDKKATVYCTSGYSATPLF